MLELLTVIIVLGIVIAISAPAYTGINDHSHQQSARSAIRNANQALESYYQDNGTFLGVSADVLHDDYNKEIHAWTSGSTWDDPLYVESSADGSSFWVCTKSAGWYGSKDGPAADIEYSKTTPTSSDDVECPIP